MKFRKLTLATICIAALSPAYFLVLSQPARQRQMISQLEDSISPELEKTVRSMFREPITITWDRMPQPFEGRGEPAGAIHRKTGELALARDRTFGIEVSASFDSNAKLKTTGFRLSCSAQPKTLRELGFSDSFLSQAIQNGKTVTDRYVDYDGFDVEVDVTPTELIIFGTQHVKRD